MEQLNNKYFLFSIIAIFTLILAVSINQLNTSFVKITEKEKCPACFGVSLCTEVLNDKIKFNYDNFQSIFNNLFGIKNVFFGTYNNIKVVMKKLAYNSELRAFDEKICADFKFHELCNRDLKKKKKLKTNFHELIISELENARMHDQRIKIRLCPTTDKADDLISYVKKENSIKKDDYYKFLWTVFKINPEPFMLQVLKAEGDWPTPKYYGACGRLVVEEFGGLPLIEFYEESWIKRAEISSSLLDGAHKFTFKNPKFAFYLTDVSMDNIVVNDKNEAIFIDLENVIIVDKYPPLNVLNHLKKWNETYVHEIETECEDCFIFSPKDICQHKISDHNYYAICQQILMQEYTDQIEGFLHDPPSEILKNYPKVMPLLRDCAKSSKNTSRISSGILLKELLDEIIKNTK